MCVCFISSLFVCGRCDCVCWIVSSGCSVFIFVLLVLVLVSMWCNLVDSLLDSGSFLFI